MIRYREKLGRWVIRKAGGFGGGGGTRMASGNDPARTGTVTWFFVLVVSVIGTFLAPRILNGNGLQYVLAAGWGLFIGGTMLMFFPSKLLITIIGGIVGTGLSNLAGVAEVIDKIATAIVKITTHLNSALKGVMTIQPTAAWVFLILVLICCLPAYRDQ
jgi:hypothetical protein